MRCKVKGCKITTRQWKQGKCWRELGMCMKHAVELHPEIYAIKLSATRVFRKKIGVRGRNHRFDTD